MCRRTPGAAEEWARANGIPKWYNNATDMLKDEEIDAVYIATPPDSHLELGLAVAAAGKACLCEKPLARNSAEAAAIAGAFECAGIPLYTAYYRRALPRYVKAKESLPRLGRIKEVRVSVRRNKPDGGWRTQRNVSGGGHAVDIGSHVVDILDFLLGPIVVQKSIAGRKMVVEEQDEIADVVPTTGCVKVENYAEFTFMAVMHAEMKGRCVFDFDYHGKLEDNICIVGDDGILQFAALGLYGSSPVVSLTLHDGVAETDEPPKPEYVHLPLIEQIVADLRLGWKQCSATGSAGVRAAIVMDAVLEHASEHPRLAMASYSNDADVGLQVTAKK